MRLTILIGLLLSLVPTFLPAGTGPKIGFSELEHDFGDVRYGDSPSVELTCTNTGDDILILGRIESSCGCAKGIRGNLRIAPGSSSKIYAQIETLGMPPGRHSKTISVHSNDPEHPRTSLRLTFNVIRHLVINPDFLAGRLSEPDKDAVFDLRATNHSAKVIVLKTATVNSSEARLIPDEVVVPPGAQTRFQLSVRTKPEQNQAHVKGVALIETNDALEKILPVRYFIQFPKKKDVSGRN
ncbi:DUF1573 domain-containing protein [Desulfomonile tiedjei]|uniref:DUF1573 domain-containing protein n=1 Tax=Desulfomonile tiedjei (strain ATCC 49306 / DSM 6799 / DCB-1) TaxID=706587 RepID=I4CBC1_DESTA|nr:DUF1573 domain-containing protein [Desulfomonile tiedjei]AFM26862.1 Protein of unknown function (DUF1573) [Desulfomonile tiedjei DSM 6799]